MQFNSIFANTSTHLQESRVSNIERSGLKTLDYGRWLQPYTDHLRSFTSD
jgi:hypothetical protein